MAFSHTKIIDGRQIQNTRSGLTVVVTYYVADEGPTSPEAAINYMIGEFPIDAPHPIWGEDAIVSGHQLVRAVSKSKFVVAVIYQSPRVLVGGVTLKQIRSRTDLLQYTIPTVTNTQVIENGPAVPLRGEDLIITRPRKTISRSFYVGAFGEANVNEVLAAEGELAGKTCKFPIPPSQEREPALLLFTSADVYSDSENRLFAVYNFTTLMPRPAETIAIPAVNPVALEIPALDWLDEMSAYIDETNMQTVIHVRTAESIYGEHFNAAILPGVEG